MTRVKITVSLPLEVVEWLKRKVDEGVYPNLSAGVEACVRNKMEEERERAHGGP